MQTSQSILCFGLLQKVLHLFNRYITNVLIGCLLVSVFSLLSISASIAQCLTDFTKLVPEPSTDYSQNFGRSVAMHNEYMAVGIPNNDSLGRITGIVNLYKKAGDTWKKINVVVPTTPPDALQFGATVVLSENYLIVGCAGYGGKVYVFKKTASDWSSYTLLASLSVNGSVYFGASPYSQLPIAISEDEQTIAISDMGAPVTGMGVSPYFIGAIYVYHKPSIQEWSNLINPTRIIAPNGDVADFGRGGLALKGNYLVAGSPYTEEGGNLYVFHDPSGSFSNFSLEASLKPGNSQSYFLGSYNIVITEDGIFTSGTSFVDNEGKFVVLFFQRPASGNWVDAAPTCVLNVDPDIEMPPLVKHSFQVMAMICL